MSSMGFSVGSCHLISWSYSNSVTRGHILPTATQVLVGTGEIFHDFWLQYMVVRFCCRKSTMTLYYRWGAAVRLLPQVVDYIKFPIMHW